MDLTGSPGGLKLKSLASSAFKTYSHPQHFIGWERRKQNITEKVIPTFPFPLCSILGGCCQHFGPRLLEPRTTLLPSDPPHFADPKDKTPAECEQDRPHLAYSLPECLCSLVSASPAHILPPDPTLRYVTHHTLVTEQVFTWPVGKPEEPTDSS